MKRTSLFCPEWEEINDLDLQKVAAKYYFAYGSNLERDQFTRRERLEFRRLRGQRDHRGWLSIAHERGRGEHAVQQRE